ncbi:LytR/AlgR family response regulator transcription factor [Runella slithyformis]|uniref:Two component transcriptional regulator, LytTR family n=1 Tax=Runella slithyformis (strain ATCC 29530 / DSM 19594 / LMG 11500 / NCIMB 11436 / LSU 4) TaxID=761193 RepID=A0A7U3ZME1_RUNSL|nr:LytTR family DNA-binding domain-containing protein [Runella slithyformis]AEI49891.1 two component transcriptional regulator, LytTR family [Runella slithyformis DSM 19594]
MNVLIVEDEKLTAQRLQMLLHRYDPNIRILAQLPSVTKTLQWFRDRPPIAPDLLFLDIHLEDDLGFRIIEDLKLTIPVIFTTAYNEYMLQAFKVNSIDYLLKPIDADELAAALDKFRLFWPTKPVPSTENQLASLAHLLEKSNAGTYKDRFMVAIGTKLRSIKTQDIAYFSLEDKVTLLITNEGLRLSVDYSIEKLVQLLDPHQFFRVNRSFLVSLSAIHTVHTYSGGKLKLDLVPLPRQEVFVSGDRITGFKEWLGK